MDDGTATVSGVRETATLYVPRPLAVYRVRAMNLFKRCECADQEKCPHPYQYCFVVDGQRHRGSTHTADPRKADKVATRKKSAAYDEKTGVAPRKSVKLSAHITTYLTHTKDANKTSYKDKTVLDSLLETVGDKNLDAIRPFDLEKWKTDRAKDVSKSTVNREFNIVRGCFSRAVDWGHLDTSPAAVVKHYKVDDQRVRVLSDAELRTVLALPDPFVVLACRATLESLARISELLSLQAHHIGPTWMERRVKGGKVIRVAITPELRTLLIARAHGGSGFIFGEGATGHPPTQQTASNRVLRALQGAGIVDASHHTMRHTGVTIMLEGGINPRTIQQLAGWSSLRMLERYGHSRDAESMRAVRTVASFLDETMSSSGVATKEATRPEIHSTANTR